MGKSARERPASERRKHPRVAADIQGHIVCHVGRGTIAVKTHNVSCSGLYCRVTEFIAPFTIVRIAMALPVHEGDASRNKIVDFDGVVVRTDPEQADPAVSAYDVAVFFSGITEEAKELISRYVREHAGQE